MDHLDAQTLNYYSTHSQQLAGRYLSVNGGVSDYFADAFNGFGKILDIGCGSGRDLARLRQLGHDVAGIDACQAMLDIAAQTCRTAGFAAEGSLALDCLPELKSCSDSSFDGLLCSAVLMHLPEEYLFDAIYGMRRVLRPGGRLLLSIPARRPDIDPKTRRDPHDRYFADLPPAKLKLLLERVGFRLLWEKETADAQDRPGTFWATFLFQRFGDDAGRPLDLVESILNRDKKDATYKLALFRALSEIAQTQYNLATYDLPGQVGIPIRTLAERWLVYYWPLIASEKFIAQKYGETQDGSKPIAIRAPIGKVINSFSEGGGLPAFLVALKNNGLPADVQEYYRMAIRKIESTIWNMPVRYAGGGADFSVFGFDKTTRQVTMPLELWRELTMTGNWIQDATILRWAELTERLSRGATSLSAIVEKLLSISDPERETRDARLLFEQTGVSECVWSGRPIRASRFDMDHVIPFALWHNNDLWNLLPCHPEINNNKRDALPSNGLLHRRRDEIIGCWEVLRESLSERFEREATGFCGNLPLQRNKWQIQLFSRLVEAVELTAFRRCVPRWEPPAQSAAVRMPSSARGKRANSNAFPAQSHMNQPAAGPGARLVEQESAFEIRNYADIRGEAFVRYLPVIGTLAAGAAYTGFDISDLKYATECPWIIVPDRLAGRNRFVVRIAGNSMEPELNIGDRIIFEYHRAPRKPNQIVIANLTELGITSDLTTEHAVKRLIQSPDYWIFRSTNPAYKDICVPKADCAYPILGIMVGKLNPPTSNSLKITKQLE